MTPEKLKRVAYAVHPFLYEGGPGDVEADKIEERIARIRQGLIPEKEFRAMSSWLGNCLSICGFDQTPMPKVTGIEAGEMGIPDFLAFVQYKEKVLPVLIEVKVSEERTLIWSEKYLQSLQRFARILGLPLLVAWKWQIRWALVDIAHFEKKVTAFHLPIERALEENLMSLLLGEVMYLLTDDVAFVWEAEILDWQPRENELIPPGEHQFRFKGAFFSIGERKLDEYPKGLPALFFASPQEHEIRKVGGNNIQVVYKVRPNTTPSITDVLLTELYLRTSGEEIDWDKEIMEGPLPESGVFYRKLLEDGVKQGFTMYVLHQVPKTMPQFLK